LPEDISAALEAQWDDVPRRSLEAIAIEGYRTGGLTEAQVRRLLELDARFQVHALLKEHHVPLRYTEADVEDDLSAHRELVILPSRRSSSPTAALCTISFCSTTVNFFGASTAGRRARRRARRRNLRVTGTLGVLRAGAEQGLVNVPALIGRLETTSFTVDDALVNAIFRRWLGP
jgi:hypothetical protein